MLADTLPDPIDTISFLNSLGGDRRALKLARGSPAPASSPSAAPSRPKFGGRASPPRTSTIGPLRAPPPSVYFAPFPAAYQDFDGDEERATSESLANLRSLLSAVIAPPAWLRASSSQSRARAAIRPAPARSCRASERFCDETRNPVGRRRGPDWLREDRQDWAVSTPTSSPTWSSSPRPSRRPAALSDRARAASSRKRWARAPTAQLTGNPVACAAGVAVLETIHDESLVLTRQAPRHE